MAAENEELVSSIDEQVNKVLSEGGDVIVLLTSFAERMNDVWKIMHTTTEDELNLYCQRYKGFYYLMKVLEEMALGISEGKISVPR